MKSTAPARTSTGGQSMDPLLDLLAAKRIKAKRAQSPAAYLHSLTHLHLDNAHLRGTLSAALCSHTPRASVAYLNSNQLKDVYALTALTSLTSLYLQVQRHSIDCICACLPQVMSGSSRYECTNPLLTLLPTVRSLQNNHLTSLASLGLLTNLAKLHAEENQLESLSGLERLTKLRELHLCRQRTPADSALKLEAATLAGLSGGLLALKLSACGITSVADLGCLSNLDALDLSQNKLGAGHIDDVLAVVECWPRLRELDTRGSGLERSKDKWEDQVRTTLSRRCHVRRLITCMSVALHAACVSRRPECC